MHSAAPKAVCLNRSEMNPQGGCLAKLPDAWQIAFGVNAPRHPMDQPEDSAVLSLADQQLLMTTDLGKQMQLLMPTLLELIAVEAI
jgi:hypothetical protein